MMLNKQVAIVASYAFGILIKHNFHSECHWGNIGFLSYAVLLYVFAFYLLASRQIAPGQSQKPAS